MVDTYACVETPSGLLTAKIIIVIIIN